MRAVRTSHRFFALAVGLLSFTAVVTPSAVAGVGGETAAPSWTPPGSQAETAGWRDVRQLATVSPTQAWAVGDHTPSGYRETLKTWNGSTWSNARRLRYDVGGLLGVDAVGPDDAWAVGWYSPVRGGIPRSLAQHWDGTRWTRTHGPTPHGLILTAVSILAPDDVWAVGTGDGTGVVGNGTLAEHWSGAHWSIVPTPQVSGTLTAGLGGVAAVTPDDVWAIGSVYIEPPGENAAILEHWDGKQWSLVGDPVPNEELTGVAASGPDDVWVVGTVPTGGFAEHFNGHKWVTVGMPSPQGREAVINGLTVESPDDAWAVGDSFLADHRNLTLTEHWDGTQWSIVHAPSPGATANRLDAVSGDSPTDVWAAGFFSNGDEERSKVLFLHWDGQKWTGYRTGQGSGTP